MKIILMKKCLIGTETRPRPLDGKAFDCADAEAKALIAVGYARAAKNQDAEGKAIDAAPENKAIDAAPENKTASGSSKHIK